jgi:hypothetical protein
LVVSTWPLTLNVKVRAEAEPDIAKVWRAIDPSVEWTGLVYVYDTLKPDPVAVPTAPPHEVTAIEKARAPTIPQQANARFVWAGPEGIGPCTRIEP